MRRGARAHGVKNLVFSSSATVYGEPEFIPITEDCPKHDATNPHGWTKSMLEQVLTDLYVGDDEWNKKLLHYFNPIGAHESGLIGEDPKGIPNNLPPYVAQVAVGVSKASACSATIIPRTTAPACATTSTWWILRAATWRRSTDGRKVGTGEAKTAGTMAGEPAADGTRRGVGIFNLGTGTGSSVLDVVHSFERACGRELPYQIKPRRAGDVAVNYAACDKARDELGWVAQYDPTACADGWRWQSQNRTATRPSKRPNPSRRDIVLLVVHRPIGRVEQLLIGSAILRIARHPDAQSDGHPSERRRLPAINELRASRFALDNRIVVCAHEERHELVAPTRPTGSR